MCEYQTVICGKNQGLNLGLLLLPFHFGCWVVLFLFIPEELTTSQGAPWGWHEG